MSFMDRLETRFGDDVLLHYGVKGMKWKEQKKKEKEDASSKKQGYKTEGRAKSANVEDKEKLQHPMLIKLMFSGLKTLLERMKVCY